MSQPDILDDLVAFNRWLCVTRVRAALGVMAIALALRVCGAASIALLPILGIVGVLLLFSAVGLLWPAVARTPRLFFHVQNFVDLAGISIGIAVAAPSDMALLFRLLYMLVIVPASLLSVRWGLLVATFATLWHEALLLADRGVSLAVLGTFESLVPSFLFYLVAQQAFFYGTHLERKNKVLAQLARRLENGRERLAALVRIARTLNSTLDAPELLARVNRSAVEALGADWGATFLVDAAQDTFRLAALSDVEVMGSELSRVAFPTAAWPVIERMRHEQICVLTGEEAERTSPLFTGGRRLVAVFFAGLYRSETLVGFLALGYAGEAPGREGAIHQLSAIAEHAAIALHNAQLLEDARQASALKTEFLSTVSHELRTPLNAIIGYTEMLREEAAGPLSAEQFELFGRIHTRTHELLELIEATLHVGRIETGRDAVTPAPVRLSDLIDTMQAHTAGLPHARQVAFTWDLPDTGGTIVTDRARVALVVRNLVSNALKFTTEGGVTVRVRPEGAALVIEVSDSGPGVAPEHVAVIFDMFRQLDTAASRQHGGVGLGLYIVKQVVERLGGTVTVDSTIGRGSTFRVVLPNYAPDVQTAAAQLPASCPSAA